MKKTIRDFDLKNKKVIIRCDLNVPMKNGKIDDDNRIKESIKTIDYAIKNEAKVIILSHLGRIKSEEDKNSKSLFEVSIRLSELLNKKVIFLKDNKGKLVEETIDKMKNGDIVLLENTRYNDYPDKLESTNDEALGKYWASLGEIFINDAFGTCHREHASNVGIANNLPSGIGFLVEKELNMLDGIVNNPKKPFIGIMGGAKMNDKIKVIDKMVEKCDYLLLGGGIANTFLTAKGYNLGKSIYDEESINHAKKILDKYKDKIILPVDGYASNDYADNLEVKYVNIDNVDKDLMILDIGPDSVRLFEKYLKEAKTVFLNGPVGVSEFSNFEYGTKSLLEILSNLNAKVIIGGGDSASSAIRFGYKNSFAHISTGGGASLEYIEGKEMPGIECIDNM